MRLFKKKKVTQEAPPTEPSRKDIIGGVIQGVDSHVTQFLNDIQELSAILDSGDVNNVKEPEPQTIEAFIRELLAKGLGENTTYSRVTYINELGGISALTLAEAEGFYLQASFILDVTEGTWCLVANSPELPEGIPVKPQPLVEDFSTLVTEWVVSGFS